MEKQNMLKSFIFLQLVVLILSVQATNGEYCRRFLLSGLDPKYVGLVQFEDEYFLKNFTWNNFPVYGTRDNDTFFYLNKAGLALVLGRNSSDELGLDALVYRIQNHNGTELARRLTYTKYPFNNIIDKWVHYDYSRSGWYVVSNITIRPVCQDWDADFNSKCDGGLLYFNQTLRQTTSDGRLNYINIPSTYFYKQVNTVVNLRPVYRRYIDGELDSAYLYYHVYSDGSGFWQVGYNPHEKACFLAAEDPAMRPEYITSGWQYYGGTRGSWRADSSIFLKCKGSLSSQTNSCLTLNPCRNGGQCRQNQNKEILCDCSSNSWSGPYCENHTVTCQRPSVPGFYNYRISTHYCNPFQSSTSYYFAICEKPSDDSTQGQWIAHGKCEPPTTPGTSPTPYPTKPYPGYVDPTKSSKVFSESFLEWLHDNHGGMLAMFLVLSICLQFFIPLIIYLKQFFSHVDNTEPIARLQVIMEEIKQQVDDHRVRMEDFNRRHPEPEEMFSNTTREEFNRLESEAEAAAQKKQEEYDTCRKLIVKEKPSYCRIMSADYNISLWLWIIFLIFIEATGWSDKNYLMYICMVYSSCMIALLYLCILVECIFSRESDYLSSMGDMGTLQSSIDKMKATQPDIAMTAEAYHYETRTRIVYYTDAYGNSCSRMETYQEKVVTANIVEPFVFQYWRDVSQQQVEGVADRGVTKVNLECLIVPGDAQTKLAYEQTYENFKATHQHRDTFVDFDRTQQVDGFQRRLAAFKDPNTKPWWMTSGIFYLASLAGFTWIYRIFFHKFSNTTSYVLIKHFYMDTPTYRFSRNSQLASYDPRVSILVAKVDLFVVQVEGGGNPDDTTIPVITEYEEDQYTQSSTAELTQNEVQTINLKNMQRATMDDDNPPIVQEID